MADGFKLRDPDFDARIRDSFSRQPFMRHIGADIEELAPGRCALHLPLREHLTQQHGFFHGGVVASLADNAGAYAAFTLIDAEQSMLTVEFKVNLLSPGMGEKLRAVGEVIRAGRSLSVSRVSVWAIQGIDEVRCAEALVTMMALNERGDR
jgi:uncharacterized protein (TIGR00369 family)